MLLASRALASLARLQAPPHWMLAHFLTQQHQVTRPPLWWHAVSQKKILQIIIFMVTVINQSYKTKYLNVCQIFVFNIQIDIYNLISMILCGHISFVSFIYLFYLLL